MSNRAYDFASLVQKINTACFGLQALSNDELRLKTRLTVREINLQEKRIAALDEALVTVFAIVKETARRFSVGEVAVTANDYDRELSAKYDFLYLEGEKAIYKNAWYAGGVLTKWNMVHFDEQLLGGILLHHGYAVEMATGEGKTLVATCPVFLNALTHQGVHLMTVNDYLSRRDFELTRPLYMFHGLTVDCLECYRGGDEGKKQAYKADIVFGANSTFVFDYLNDHLVSRPEDSYQTTHHFAIVDELDSILIDGANIPHIVGGGARFNYGQTYKEYAPVVQELIGKGRSFFRANSIKKEACFTKKGKQWLAQKTGIGELFATEKSCVSLEEDESRYETGSSLRKVLFIQNVLNNLLAAYTIYEKDVDYIVTSGVVTIVDRNTGRPLQNSRWENGLHTAVEIKEKVSPKDDFDGIAVISLGNYFKLYEKLAGMSGTIMPVAAELAGVYGLKSRPLPTHKPVIREEKPLRVFRDSKSKNAAIVELLNAIQRGGRPSLVGCKTIKHTEMLSSDLRERGLSFKCLTAKTLKDEAFAISKAGESGSITLSTSIAGRGTDIKPSEESLSSGGLYVVGADLFESVRVDRQLMGRTGRQGNPGTSEFFTSLDDDILEYLARKDRNALSSLASRSDYDEISSDEVRAFFEKAQSQKENVMRRQRRILARKDDIIAPHRVQYYQLRGDILNGRISGDAVVQELLRLSCTQNDELHSHLYVLFQRARGLAFQGKMNDDSMEMVSIPFSDNRKVFALRFETAELLGENGFSYFERETKRQIVLQVYDAYWKRLVLYVLSGLDKQEVSTLNEKYERLMREADKSIISRLKESTIPADKVETGPVYESGTSHTHEMIKDPRPSLSSDQPCPCGSGKKYCECHGKNNRSIPRRRNRR